MEIDKTTLDDLSIFNREEEFSVFHKLDFTRTAGGKHYLSEHFRHPLTSLSSIRAIQEVIQYIARQEQQWPSIITNGTIMVMEKFYDSGIENIPAPRGGFSIVHDFAYRLWNMGDFSLIKYSLLHFGNFIKGLQQLNAAFNHPDAPFLLQQLLQKVDKCLQAPELTALPNEDFNRVSATPKVLAYGYYVQNRYRTFITDLIDIYHQLDAYYSMALAVKRHELSFPCFVEQASPVVKAEELYHILLQKPVAYNLQLDQSSNFLFLTGANMAGKSTFIKAVGIAVYLAHLGMGVPARQLTLTLFDGLLSNIQVQDNIFKGESYFYNEVKRIKNTVMKVNNGKHWLILIDELFKGTNFQDAKNCSIAVIQGLLKMSNSLFLLSTHLYEIAEALSDYKNISFKYFESRVEEDALRFSYQLKNGISNDRIGFLILKKEKVLELLEKINTAEKPVNS